MPADHNDQKEKGEQLDCGSNELKEEIDCIDNPLLKSQRETILGLKAMCQNGGGKKGNCLSQINALEHVQRF